ncbi:MAG TPA: twin-arginine translocase TatA/TatE family subunit [Candidatus Omnitrophota bacterium]|nr:twin-arginine translocase TatA/TatE family subunit [Candidatus Omnitrophota bacterium]HPN88329.1 twin-arginine translocase TatA/TatE family subunit [Candidatus Omnitrophota bacterium]
MGRIGFMEIFFILLVIVLLFGAKKLPEIGKALAEAIREFRKASKDIEKDVKESLDDKKS